MHRTLLFIMLAGFAPVFAQDSASITGDPNDLSRPVSTLLDQLRRRERISVTYEDPRYSNTRDIQDVTPQVAKNLSPAENRSNSRILVPRGRAITFAYSRRELRTPEGTEATISRMLDEYRSLGGPTFAVVREGVRLHVVPQEVLNADGERIRVDSILDVSIDIPSGRRSSSQLLQLICDHIKERTGFRVEPGTGDPTNADLTRLEINAQTARAAIGQLLDSLATPGDFVWDLYYDPSSEFYVLNFSYIGSAGLVRK